MHCSSLPTFDSDIICVSKSGMWSSVWLVGTKLFCFNLGPCGNIWTDSQLILLHRYDSYESRLQRSKRNES